MIQVNSSAFIYRPVKQVFEFISNLENDFLWQYGILEASRVTEGTTSGVGSFFRSVGHFMGHRNVSTYEVTDYEFNRKFGFKSISGPLLSHTLYTLEMSNGCTKLNVSTQASVTSAIQVNEHVVEKQMKKQLGENLAMLRQLLETK